MGANGGNGFSSAVAWLGVASLALLVLWLAILVIRLRLESLINRRVIASLQRVRPIQEEKAPWWRAFEFLPAGVWFALAFMILLLLYATLE